MLRLFTDDELRARYQATVADEAVAEYWDYFERLGREAERLLIERELKVNPVRVDLVSSDGTSTRSVAVIPDAWF